MDLGWCWSMFLPGPYFCYTLKWQIVTSPAPLLIRSSHQLSAVHRTAAPPLLVRSETPSIQHGVVNHGIQLRAALLQRLEDVHGLPAAGLPRPTPAALRDTPDRGWSVRSVCRNGRSLHPSNAGPTSLVLNHACPKVELVIVGDCGLACP